MNKVVTYMLTVMLIGMVFLSVYMLLPVYFENQRTQSALAQMERSLQQQNDEMRELQKAIKDLRENYRAIERVAREKLGMCREGEKIYHFDSPASLNPMPMPEKR